MKTNYNKIRQSIAEIDEARANLNLVARQRIGVIEGGPSITEENAEFERCATNLRRLVRSAIAAKCRLRKLREVCGRDPVVDLILENAERETEYNRAYARENR